MSALFNTSKSRSFIPSTQKTIASSSNRLETEKSKNASSSWFQKAITLDQAIEFYSNFKQNPTDSKARVGLKEVLNLNPELRNGLFNAYSKL